MKHLSSFILLAFLLTTSCTSTKKLNYLNNLPEANGEEYFTMDIPEYKIQPRDILYISVRAINTNRTSLSPGMMSIPRDLLFFL
jgi:hypothetical protein